jgi:hypothetical protein
VSVAQVTRLIDARIGEQSQFQFSQNEPNSIFAERTQFRRGAPRGRPGRATTRVAPTKWPGRARTKPTGAAQATVHERSHSIRGEAGEQTQFDFRRTNPIRRDSRGRRDRSRTSPSSGVAQAATPAMPFGSVTSQPRHAFRPLAVALPVTMRDATIPPDTARKRRNSRPDDPQTPRNLRARPTYSWLPGTGLNLMPRNATPTGATVVASTIIAVQMMLIEVAAMAVVP